MLRSLKRRGKTYVERRGILHSIKSNLRVLTIYICLFQIIVTIAFSVPFGQAVLPLCPPQHANLKEWKTGRGTKVGDQTVRVVLSVVLKWTSRSLISAAHWHCVIRRSICKWGRKQRSTI